MKKAIMLGMLLGAAMLFNACNLDDGQNFRFTTLNIVDANVPEFFELNKTYSIEVTYERPDSCTFFEGFNISRPALTDRDVAVIGSVLTEETACTPAIEEITASFDFIVLYRGEYHFRFFAGRDENNDSIFLEYTIPVEE